MAIETFEAVKPLLAAHEGGYSSDRKDPGNWSSGKAGVGRLVGTNHGISAPALAEWRGRHVSAAEMKALSKEEAFQIFKAKYWDTVGGDQLPAGVDYACYDYSVNSGPGRAARDLQRVVGAKDVDGVVGPSTLRAIQTCGKFPAEIVNELCDRRLAFMKSLRTWGRYGKGWARRVSEVRAKGLSLARNHKVTDVPDPKPVPVPPAKPEDKSGWKTWTTPDGITKGIGALSGLGAMLSGTGPVQWALAIVFVIAAGVGGYLAIQQYKERDD